LSSFLKFLAKYLAKVLNLRESLPRFSDVVEAVVKAVDLVVELGLPVLGLVSAAGVDFTEPF
jgi:hypothetical protein